MAIRPFLTLTSQVCALKDLSIETDAVLCALVPADFPATAFQLTTETPELFRDSPFLRERNCLVVPFLDVKKCELSEELIVLSLTYFDQIRLRFGCMPFAVP
jgi:hypothetical protein